MFIVHDNAYYESRKPQPDLGPFKNFLRFIWNSEKRAFLDRTAKEWAQVFLFYICFFGVLFAILAFQMWVTVYYVSSYDRPYFQYRQSSPSNLFERSKRNLRSTYFDFGSPGIGFHPNILSPTAVPIIWINESHEKGKSARYVEVLDNVLKGYIKNETNYDPFCIDGKLRTHYSEKPCFFDVRQLGKCSKSPYGYLNILEPCILIKFNKRFDWIPYYYNQTSQLPSEMPDSLKNLIKLSKKFYIWLSCIGANDIDKEHIGEIEYLPAPGFGVQYFPFMGQSDYLSPIVALRFRNLTVNRLITVECTMWAQNIEHQHRYNLDFQIMIG